MLTLHPTRGAVDLVLNDLIQENRKLSTPIELLAMLEHRMASQDLAQNWSLAWRMRRLSACRAHTTIFCAIAPQDEKCGPLWMQGLLGRKQDGLRKRCRI